MDNARMTVKGGAAEAAVKGYGGNVYLRQEEAAHYMQLHPRSLERFHCDGSGPAFRKAGKRVLCSVADIEEWFAARRFRSTAEADAAREGRAGP